MHKILFLFVWYCNSTIKDSWVRRFVGLCHFHLYKCLRVFRRYFCFQRWNQQYLFFCAHANNVSWKGSCILKSYPCCLDFQKKPWSLLNVYVMVLMVTEIMTYQIVIRCCERIREKPISMFPMLYFWKMFLI